MIIGDPSFSTLEKKEGRLPLITEFHRAVVNIEAFKGTLRDRAVTKAGSTERLAVLAQMDAALYELAQADAEAIVNSVTTAFAGPNLRAAGSRKAWNGLVVTGISSTSYHISGPILGIPIMMSPATTARAARRVAPIGAPRATITQKSVDYAMGGLAWTSPWTALVTALVQLNLAARTKPSASARAQLNSVQTLVDDLRAQVSWVDVFQVMDFISFDAEGVVVPRVLADELGLLPKAQAVAPSDAGCYTAVLEMEQLAGDTASSMALVLSLTSRELNDMRAARPLSRGVTRMTEWLRLSYDTTTELRLEADLATMILQEPADLLALGGALCRRFGGDVPYSINTWSSAIYAVAQSVNELMGYERWSNLWSALLANAPLTVDELHTRWAAHGITQALQPHERCDAVGLLVDLARRDVEIDVDITGDVSADVAAEVGAWANSTVPYPLKLMSIPGLEGANLSVVDDGIVIAWRTTQITIRVNRVRGTDVMSKDNFLTTWARVRTGATVQRAFEVFAFEQQLMQFVYALQTVNRSDVVIESDPPRIIVSDASCFAAIDAFKALQRSRGDATSPFILTSDSPMR